MNLEYKYVYIYTYYLSSFSCSKLLSAACYTAFCACYATVAKFYLASSRFHVACWLIAREGPSSFHVSVRFPHCFGFDSCRGPTHMSVSKIFFAVHAIYLSAALVLNVTPSWNLPTWLTMPHFEHQVQTLHIACRPRAWLRRLHCGVSCPYGHRSVTRAFILQY